MVIAAATRKVRTRCKAVDQVGRRRSAVLRVYMPFEEIDHYFENMGAATRVVHAAVGELVKYRLVEPYEPNTEEISPTNRLSVTASGHMHFEMSFNDPVYIEQMALTTAIRSEPIVRSMRTTVNQKMSTNDWTALRREFARYCVSEDKKLLKLPTHPDYTSQSQLRTEFQRWLA